MVSELMSQTPPTLPAGTIVKHGTSSTKLLPIFKHGLQVAPSQNLIAPSPKSKGLYVGGTIAYHAAVVAFSVEVSKAYADQHLIGVIAPLPKLAPVVIRFQLEEDVPIVADEDFLLFDQRLATGDLPNEYLPELAQAIQRDGLVTWSEFGAAALVRDGGLPPEWIEGVEMPKMTHGFRTKPDPDMELMLLAYYQHDRGMPQATLLNELKKRHIAPELTIKKEWRQLSEPNIKTWFPTRTQKSLKESQAWLNDFSKFSMQAGLPVEMGI